MRKATLILGLLVCTSLKGQYGGNFYGCAGGWSPQQDAENAKRYQQKLAQQAYNFIPQDPWRAIDDGTNYAKGEGWVGFSGTVLEVQSSGIRVDGQYTPPFSQYTEYSGTFFVANFPYQVAENERVSGYSAKEEGVYTYLNISGGSTTIRKLDYGMICEPPEDLVERAQNEQNVRATEQKIAARKQKEQAERNTIKWLMPQATNGDACAQCDLGEHYLNGEGVKTNLDAARYWLRMSASQGDFEASNALVSLK